MTRWHQLLEALDGAPELTDWTARSITTRRAWHQRGDGQQASGNQSVQHLGGQVHRDVAAGRGSARFVVDLDADLPTLLADGAARALAAVGPPWRSAPPAAMARVELADPELASTEIERMSERLVDESHAAAQHAGGAVTALDLTVEYTDVQVASARGLRARWLATGYDVDLTVHRGGCRAHLRRQARRYRELDLSAALDAALDRAERRADAPPTPPGRYQIIASAAALLHDGDGLFAALIAQADPALERRGLVRYRPGQPVAAGAAQLPDPLTVSSDGAMPYGLASAPLTDDAEPVRRFELVTRGVARGLALTGREAARRGADPNGGVRGLVIAAGDAASDALVDGDDGPSLIVESFDWIDVSPVTGHFRAAIGLATRLHRGTRAVVTGGIVGGDAIAALALGRRSRETYAAGNYRGPARWALGELVVD